MSAFLPRVRTGIRKPWLSMVSTLALSTMSLFLPVTPTFAQSPAAGLAAKLEVKDAWIRWLPSGLPAGGYVTLVNRSAQPLVLIGASSDTYGEIDLHRSSQDGGMSRMAMVDKIVIPARSTLSFAATGYHLMLMQPRKTLAPGGRVPITLKFAGGESQTVEFELRQPNGSAPDQGTMGDMSGMQDMKDMKDMKNMPGMQH